jgi:hypothetical protein
VISISTKKYSAITARRSPPPWLDQQQQSRRPHDNRRLCLIASNNAAVANKEEQTASYGGCRTGSEGRWVTVLQPPVRTSKHTPPRTRPSVLAVLRLTMNSNLTD